MTFKETNSKYLLCDGQLISCKINFVDKISVIIILKVREKIDGKYKTVNLELKFSNLIELNIFEDFTSNNYSDITFVELETGEYYLSLDPYENSNEPNENDNFIVKAKFLEVIEK